MQRPPAVLLGAVWTALVLLGEQHPGIALDNPGVKLKTVSGTGAVAPELSSIGLAPSEGAPWRVPFAPLRFSSDPGKTELQIRGRTPLQMLREVAQDGPGPLNEDEQKADAAAHEILRRAVREKDAAAKVDVASYAKEIGAKIESGGRLTIHEHTAVTFLLKSGMFDEPEAGPESDRAFNAEVRASLKKSLQASWKNLTGKERPEEKLLTRLPKMVLRKASRKARVYHAAAFIPMTRNREVRLNASKFFRDYVPENQDVLLAAGALLASIFTDSGRWAVGSLITQYVMYSVTENLLHDHLAHPKGRIGEWFQKGPKETAGWLERAVHRVIGKVMKEQVDSTSRGHVDLHHRWTFRKSFTKMFDDKATQARVDELLEKHFPPDQIEKMKDEDYATTLNSAGMAKIFSTIVPQTAAFIAAGALLGAPAWLLVPTVLMAALYPVAMGKGHPIYHVSKSEAREKASAFMKKLRETRYISYSARNHWMHHHYPDTNFNLSYPGADALMGQLMQPNLDDLFRMAEDDVLHY